MPQALDLAERNERFKAFLDQLKPERCRGSTRSCRWCCAAEGEAGLLKRLDDGTLNVAVNVAAASRHGDRARNALDRFGAQVVRRSPAADLPKVVELEPLSAHLARQLSRKASLQRILGLDDRLADPCGCRASTRAPATPCSSSTTTT